MALFNLSSAQLAQVIGLLKEKESLQAKMDQIDAELGSIETGKPLSKKRGRKPGRPRGQDPGGRGQEVQTGQTAEGTAAQGVVRGRGIGHDRQGTGGEAEGQTRQHFQLVLYDRQEGEGHQQSRRSEVRLFGLKHFRLKSTRLFGGPDYFVVRVAESDRKRSPMFPRSQVALGNVTCSPRNSISRAYSFENDGIGNEIASASTFPSITWERGRACTIF